ncbi:hypothetical protein DSM112329_00784 [Paraconexibacter sp. AEG42_29]|uniref:Uncharacterized protein n=1 Tax=Paraconexibacter sp. AEG42_29 TaxID=2997339 RepID=A0AAU7AQW4_9ACTN
MRLPSLSYANVVSSVALFAALGGVSYAAATLPRNSVGANQIRPGAVGTSELKNGAIRLPDIATSTRRSLRGAAGPAGPTGPAGAKAVSYFAVVNAGGQALRGNSSEQAHTTGGSGSYTIGFPTSVSGCAYTVTLGGVDAGNQPPGFATVRDDAGKVGVQIYDAAGSPADRPFHLIVAC